MHYLHPVNVNEQGNKDDSEVLTKRSLSKVIKHKGVSTERGVIRSDISLRFETHTVTHTVTPLTSFARSICAPFAIKYLTTERRWYSHAIASAQYPVYHRYEVEHKRVK